MTIIGNGKRYSEYKFTSEKEFEDDVVNSSKILFGKDTIFINAKKKIEAKFLGGTIPDGFFFDFNDKTDPQFYIVEVEITQHSFYNHIFPQVTKFFAFYKNTKIRKELIDKLYHIVDGDENLKTAFRELVGKTEIYKFLSDIVETSQNILLVTDGPIKELPEIIDTYTDTWGKLVKYIELKKYNSNTDTIYTITPDFENIQYIEPPELVEEVTDERGITEEDHLEGVENVVKEIYEKIKRIALNIDGNLVFNPQKYYISIKAPKNIAFMIIRNRKIRFIPMIPEEMIRIIAKHYAVAPLSKGIQNFYNGPCAAVDIPNLLYEDELTNLLSSLISYHQEDSKLHNEHENISL